MDGVQQKSTATVLQVDQRTPLSEENFRVIRSRKDVCLGNLTELEHIPTHQIIFKKEAMIGIQQDDIERKIQHIQRRIRIKHPNLITFKGISYQFKDKLEVSYYIEGFLATAAAEFANRARTRSYFEESELIISLDTCISALNHLQANEIAHGNVSPHALYMSRDGELKLVDHSLLDQEYALFHSIRDGSELCYIAPELLELVKRGVEKPDIPQQLLHKSDVFSLGMTFLCAALLEEPHDCYNWTDLTFDVENLNRRFEVMRQRYPGKFSNVLQNLLRVNPEERPDFKSLVSNLDYYKTTYTSESMEPRGSNDSDRAPSFKSPTFASSREKLLEDSKRESVPVTNSRAENITVIESKTIEEPAKSLEDGQMTFKDEEARQEKQEKRLTAASQISVEQKKQVNEGIKGEMQKEIPKKEPERPNLQENNPLEEENKKHHEAEHKRYLDDRAAKIAKANEIMRAVEMRKKQPSATNHQKNPSIQKDDLITKTEEKQQHRDIEPKTIEKVDTNKSPASPPRTYFNPLVIDIIKEIKEKNNKRFPASTRASEEISQGRKFGTPDDRFSVKDYASSNKAAINPSELKETEYKPFRRMSRDLQKSITKDPIDRVQTEEPKLIETTITSSTKQPERPQLNLREPEEKPFLRSYHLRGNGESHNRRRGPSMEKVDDLVKKIKERRQSQEGFTSPEPSKFSNSSSFNPDIQGFKTTGKKVSEINTDPKDIYSFTSPLKEFPSVAGGIRTTTSALSNERPSRKELSNSLSTDYQELLRNKLAEIERRRRERASEAKSNVSQRLSYGERSFIEDNSKLHDEIPRGEVSRTKSPYGNREPGLFSKDSARTLDRSKIASPFRRRENERRELDTPSKADELIARIRERTSIEQKEEHYPHKRSSPERRIPSPERRIPSPEKRIPSAERYRSSPRENERRSNLKLDERTDRHYHQPSYEKENRLSPVKDYERVEIKQVDIRNPKNDQKVIAPKKEIDAVPSSQTTEYKATRGLSKPIVVKENEKFSFHVNTEELGLSAQDIKKAKIIENDDRSMEKILREQKINELRKKYASYS